MERLTSYDGNYYYPHCMKGSTCDGHGSSEKCNECEFNERVCVTLGKYEDTGLTTEQIRELQERDTEYFCKTSIFDHESVVCKCGNDLEKDSGFKFCPYCGNRIKLED